MPFVQRFKWSGFLNNVTVFFLIMGLLGLSFKSTPKTYKEFNISAAMIQVLSVAPSSSQFKELFHFYKDPNKISAADAANMPVLSGTDGMIPEFGIVSFKRAKSGHEEQIVNPESLKRYE